MLGGIFGLGLGFYFQIAMANLYATFYAIPGIEAHFYGDLAALGFGISVIVALAGTINAVRKAVRLEPAEAMRPPPPEEGQTHFFGRSRIHLDEVIIHVKDGGSFHLS